MEMWRSVIVDWINAFNNNEVPLLNNYLMHDETLFSFLKKSLAIQSLDNISEQRLLQFIQKHRTKFGIRETTVEPYLKSLMLINSSLSEGFHYFLLSKLDPKIRNHVDMYLSLILSIRDRISKGIIDTIVEKSKGTCIKNDPIDLSSRSLNKDEELKFENFDGINEDEETDGTDCAMKLQGQSQQSSNEIELLKIECESFKNKYYQVSECLSNYTASIDSLNSVIEKLLTERNELKQNLNLLQERLQNNDNKIPSNDNNTSTNNNENINNNLPTSIGNNLKSKNGSQILQVRLERLDQKIINDLSQRNRHKIINKIKIDESVAPMKAKRQRIHGRDYWKIIPCTQPYQNILRIRKCNKNNNCHDNKNNYDK